MNPLETWYRYIGFQGLRVYCHCPFICAIHIAAILILSFIIFQGFTEIQSGRHG